MEGESPLFRRGGSLPPNLPHSPRTSPMSPPLRKRKFVSFFVSGGDMGEVFGVWGGRAFCRVRLSRPVGGQNMWSDARFTPHIPLLIGREITKPNANLPPKPCEAALCNKTAPPNPTKNFPREHQPKAKRNESSPCRGGCAWGKFSEGVGALEGEGVLLGEDSLSLQGLPYSLSSEIFL